MLGFAESFFAWLTSTGIAALLGLLLAMALGRFLKPKYFLAFSLGVLIWVFVDVINASGELDVNSSFSGGWEQVFLVALFVFGVFAFLSFDRSAFSPDFVGGDSLTIPILIAVAVGIHGLGEGAAFADVASTSPFNSLVLAFGGEAAGAAYVLHKLLEAMAIGAAYLVFSESQARESLGRVRDASILLVAFIIPSVIAMATGYFIAYNASYFYAMGAGTLVYAILRLSGPLFTSKPPPIPSVSSKIALSLMAGLLCIYAASLLHSYVP